MSSADDRRAQATEDAAAWLLELESGPLTEEEGDRLSAWLAESPLHVAELLHASRMQHALKRFAKRGLIQPLDRPIPATGDVVIPMNIRRPVGPPRSRLRVMGAAAASFAAVAVVVVVTLQPAGSLVVQTQIGERRELSLSDGSNITIGPSSELRINFGKRERLANLQRGVAFFRVAKDPNRPFVVDAGGTRTRDIGTAFSIERQNGRVVVTVVEGMVDVFPERKGMGFVSDRGGAVPVISLKQDEQVAISQAGVAIPVRNVNGQAEASWAQGQLIFDNTRIDDIANRFNQFNRVQIRVVSDALGARLFTGVFRADDPKSFADILALDAGARVHQADGGDIIIDAAATASDGQPPP